jgi:hypothetical protein
MALVQQMMVKKSVDTTGSCPEAIGRPYVSINMAIATNAPRIGIVAMEVCDCIGRRMETSST